MGGVLTDGGDVLSGAPSNKGGGVGGVGWGGVGGVVFFFFKQKTAYEIGQ